MKLSLGYSDEADLVPLIPLLEGKLDRDITIEPVKVKEDDLKFVFQKFDLIYVPVPLINYIPDIKFISNGARIAQSIGVRGKCEGDTVCVKSSNSTEYYFIKIFDPKRTVTRGECGCSVSIEGVEEDLTPIWRSECGDVPLVLKLIAINLDESLASKVKIAIRESASIVASQGKIPQFSKELGLKGRQGMECFINKCREAGLCSNNRYFML
ncbi:hypothetical protein L3N51_00325 [Metallosphaera sp. J1]|uniref:hypothetical protein n=1 Tax=Metallosphaera TaxID=41980 RepID=UPI001EE0B104|nr:hypothetical protein [Metallosphaera javensis (ex Hofmann et al. 2022)]MCG3108047.1 hypothetical protein [Metallosphaera javensis (ex Hofmann et al. 2022)]BCS91794.1 MAG: hypothetical protein MjAS7_0402 [Metallosphaera javensis (ex Sakai et al. 2022)]